MEFKIGDLVQLKSGGPTMTIIGMVPSDYNPTAMICMWYVGDERKREEFAPATLKKAETVDKRSPP